MSIIITNKTHSNKTKQKNDNTKFFILFHLWHRLSTLLKKKIVCSESQNKQTNKYQRTKLKRKRQNKQTKSKYKTNELVNGLVAHNDCVYDSIAP